MADRKRHRALGEIARIRAAERTAAHHELFLAGEREREAIEERRVADERTEAAVAEWHRHMARDAFMPELARALAGQLVERAGAGTAAQAHEKAMTGEREASEIEWCARDARLRQAEDLVDTSRRAIARDREDRALEALADRVTSNWCRA